MGSSSTPWWSLSSTSGWTASGRWTSAERRRLPLLRQLIQTQAPTTSPNISAVVHHWTGRYCEVAGGTIFGNLYVACGDQKIALVSQVT